jgi:hypothetical protein
VIDAETAERSAALDLRFKMKTIDLACHLAVAVGIPLEVGPDMPALSSPTVAVLKQPGLSGSMPALYKMLAKYVG